MSDLLPQLICAHLIGDFILQDDLMAREKATDSLVCAIHVTTYLIPFLVLALIANDFANWLLFAIPAQHFLQDRFQLHLCWMKLYGQTPPDKWPTGPLCVDQAWHIAFLWVFSALV